MYLSSKHELFVLIGTFLGGVTLGVVFDFFRIMRKNFKGASSVVWLQDVLMWAVSLGVVYATVFITNDGKLRWYVFVGFGAGLIIYILTLSPFVMKISTAIITFLKKVIIFIFGIFVRPVKWIYSFLKKPLVAVFKWMKKRISRFLRNQKQKNLRLKRIFKKI